MTDGGVRAISGFFYQLLGSAVGLARAAGDPAAILSLEPSGEDAIVRDSHGGTLIQFKYSAAGREISPAELAEVLSKLEEHGNGAELDWKLSTNRALSPAAQWLWEGKGKNVRLLANVAPEDQAVIKKHRGKLDLEKLTLTQLDEQLFARGRQFGLDQHEIQQGADRLVGSMMRLVNDHGAGASICSTFLDEQVAGFPGPNSLRGSDRAPEIVKQLENIAEALQGASLADTIARKSLEDMFVAADPVVVVTGPGGSGKTLSVIRAIRDHVLARQVLGGILFSDARESVEDLVAGWRSRGRRVTPEQLVKALDRLRIANGTTGSCILVLALDGLDEQGWQDRLQDVRRLLSLVWEARDKVPLDQPSPLKLVVTCRARRELDELLGGSGTGGGVKPEEMEIALDFFDESELREVWKNWFERLPAPLMSVPAELDLMSEYGRGITAIDEQVAQVLRQPTMLGCFRDLDPNQRAAIFVGDEGAWNALFERFLKWFAGRVHRRWGLGHATTRGMLRAAACVTINRNTTVHDRDRDWTVPGSDYTGQARADVDHLFEDAITSGVIETDQGSFRLPRRRPVTWRWRHQRFEDYLASLA